MRKIFLFFAAMLCAIAVGATPVVLPATLDVSNVGFRSEGLPDFVLEEGEYAGTYLDMGAHDSSNDTLLYAEWDVTIEPIKYNVAVDVYNTNSWRVQIDILNQSEEVVKAIRYKGSSGQCGHYAVGSVDLRDLEAGNYKVRARSAYAWSAMKLKDLIFEADYSGSSVALPGTLLPAYAELSAHASVTDGAIAFAPGTAPDEYATWNVSFAKAGSFNVSIDYTASNGHTYGVALLSADGQTEIGAVAEAQAWDTGVKELGAIAVPAAGNYIVKLTNATQWSEAVLNSITFASNDPQTIYLKISNDWKYPSKYAIYYFGATTNGWSDFMTEVENEEDIYTATIPAGYSQVIFVRFNSTKASTGNWDDKWSQTVDLTIEDGKDLFTITSGGTGGDCNGAWSKFEPTPAPVGCDWDNLSWIAGSNNKLKICLGDPAPSVVDVQNPHWSETTEDGIYMTFPAAAWGDISLPASKYEKQGAGILLFVSAFDLKYTDVSIVESKVEYNFTVYNADGDDVVYNVAGEPETVFGSTWNTYANKMTLEEGIYKLEKTELLLAAGDIKFKVVKNHDWATSWPSSNYVLNVAEDGIYTVTISYNPEGNVVNATATKTGEAVVRPVVKMHGNFFGEEWEDSKAFAEATDKKSASLTLTLAKGSYKFGMKFDGSWTSNGVAFTRANPSAQVVTGEGDLTLAADVAGDYTFTWTYETNTLSIAYPVKYYEYATGHLKNPECDANGRILLTLSKSGNNIVVTVKNNAAAGNTKEGLNYLWVNATGATNNNATYGSHSAADVEKVSVTVTFDAAQESYVFNNIHWSYSGWEGEWAIDGLTVPASQICELEDGYYLVGKFGGVEAWDLDDLSAEKRFEANPSTEGEYMLTATLAENDNLKVVKVINDAYGPWYPATDPNYVVGADYTGEKTIYFRPNGDGGEGWHYGYIYIAPNEPTAIDNANVAEKAQKFIENGQLFIELNGIRYNVIGQTVK